MTLYPKIIKLHFKNGVTIRELSEVFRDELSDFNEFGFKLSNLEKVQMIVSNEIVQIEKLRQETKSDEINNVFPKESMQVINTANGVIYESIQVAAKKEYINVATLQKKLSGQRTNNTNLRIYKTS